MGIFGWTASPLDSAESKRESTATSPPHPESRTVGQNVMSSLLSLVQRIWQMALTWAWRASPSLRLSESNKKEELKIKDHTDGSLSIYKLPMKEKITLPQQMITGQSIGEQGEFQEKVLLVVGAAGCGKSTLINCMVNYIMGVKWEDDFRFKVAPEGVPIGNDQMKYLTAYTFYPMQGSPLSHKLTIIDTPGFGNTQGLKRDKDIVKQIKQFFSIPAPNGVRHINGIAFVTQASHVRLTPNQEYIFNFILSILGKDLCKNIFLMITSADSQKPPILQALNDAKVTVSDRHFKFNNSVLFKDNKEDEDSFDALFWKMSFQALADFFTELFSADSVSIDLTMEVLNERDQLERLLEDMVQDVTTGAKRFDEMQEDERMHKAQKCHVRLNEIALKPNPGLSLDHLQLLIESEKQQGESGWMQRIEYLEDVKRQAEMLFNKKRRLAEIARREELILKDGTPSIYKLAMEENLKDERRMIAKHSVGEPGQFQEKVLLVIGATGAGKSTLINGMANYIMGVKWEDDFRFKVVTDDPNVSTSKSQTKFITAYTFYPMEGSALSYKLTIIDTPGFGDTQGLKRDKDIVKQIQQFFSIPTPNGIRDIDGIAFVTQASHVHLTPNQEYIFNFILSILGKDLCKNIFLMITSADSHKPPILQALNDAKLEVSNRHFKFNNSVLFKDNKEDEDSFDALFWKMSFRALAYFFTELSSTESVSVDLTMEVLNERDQLQRLLEDMIQDITIGTKRFEEMQEDERMHKAQKCHVRLNEIALKPNPGLNLDRLQLLIESEKQQAESGWFQRVEYLKDVKLQAEMLFNKKRRLAEIARREELKLKDGTPSIYKLAMEENLTDAGKMISKQSIGKPGQLQEKVLLVIGATGAGKSTLINGMANYIMGVKWEDDFRFKVVTDDPTVSTSKSQTKFITAYTFYPMEGSALSYKLTVIDTPGFGDFRGLKRDKDIVKQIKQLFSIPTPNGVRHIDGIAFVTQASHVRLTPNQEYIFNFILSILGKDLCKNIFLMITSADSQKPPILQALNDAKVTVSDRHFKFNNSVLFKDNKEDEDSFDALFWKMSFQALADFFTELSSTESVSIDKTMEVLNEREQLQRLLEDMVQDVTINAKTFEKIQGDERMHKARKCHVRLNEIALKPNPALNFDHLQLLIESEKQQAESGWFQRVEYLKDVKHQAEMLFNKKRRLAEIARREELILKDGTPSIYKLAMKENLTDERRMIAKHSVGEPGQFQEKVLLVIGATGAGKSTLINGMANYIMGVKWEDDFRFKVVTDDPNVSTSKSQTKFITAYTFYPMEGSALSYKLTIIDTPGFGDTQGLKRDKDIVKQIQQFFSIPTPNGIRDIDGIAFVTQASHVHLTPNQEYIFNFILSILGKDLCKNIFLMITSADSQKPPILQALNDAKLEVSNRHFKFNNSVLFKDNKEDEDSFDALFWKMSFRALAYFFTELSSTESVSVDLTMEVLNERDQLQRLLEDMIQDITTGAKRFEEMQEDERMHKAQKCHVRLNEIALKPNPGLNLDHLQLLIESEKQQAESGWFQRVEYLKDVKLQAEMLFNKKRRLAEIARREELKLKDGTPSIYKLAMEENLTDAGKMISKQSIGKPGQLQEKVLLVIGATGAGKSTLINGMANYIMGVKWEDDFRFKVVTDDPNVSTSKSQTKFITAYTFYPMEGSALSYKLTVIDTPGFSDSQGLKRDKDVVKQIQQFFSIPSPNGVRHIDGIAFVTQASLVRLTPNQEYIFNFILSTLGKDLCKNIFLMITSADSHKPPIVQALNDAKVTVSDRHFKFNNSALFKDNKEDEDSFDALFWKMSFQALADFFTELSSTESVSIDKTMEVLNEREQLQGLLEDMVQNVTTDAKSFEKIQGDERMHKARKCHVRLNEIALKPNPALNFDHLQLLIESEKQQAESGWFQRVEYLKDVKLQAEMLFNKKRRLAEIARREELILKDGTPSIYKLAMKENLKDERRMIAKHSVGEPGQFQEKVLLVIGATGAGKSTLINGMANYIMGVKWEDDFRFKVVTDDPNVSTSKSQTKFITAYTFYPMEGSALSYKLTIIDTPGFGDTEGLKRDKAITKQIEEFFSIPLPNGVSHLDGVGFVAQGSLARLTPTQEYIFSSVLSIFGKDLSQSIFMMVTFADGQKPPVLKAIKDAGVTKSVKHFKFNNSALFADNREGNFDAMFWKMGFLSFKSFFEELSKAKSVHLDLTKEVLKERDQLQALLEGLNPQINLGLEKIEEMRQEEIVLQHRESEIETSKEFTYTVEVNKPHQVDISGEGKHTTTCIKCNFTCHNECAYSDDNDKVKCCAMSGDNCVVCPKKCHWTEHKNLPYVWEFKKVVETRTSEDLKRKYESAKEGKSKVESMIDKLDEELQKMHFEVMNNILKAQQCLRRLDQIALKPNPLSNVEYIELLIESEKQTANHGWKQRIRYLEEAKRQAAMLSKVTAVKASKEKVEESTRSGDKWYSRFKFWERK